MENRPKISIGLAVYNGQDHIRASLDSFLAQSYKNFEIIISDNASDDKTKEICLNYSRLDKRIIYYRNADNKGSVYNFNRVFELSDGEYFIWASSHDFWKPDFLEKSLCVLENNKKVVLAYSLAESIGSNHDGKVKVFHGPDTRGLSFMSRVQTVFWGIQYAYPIYGLIRMENLKQTGLFRKIIGPDLVLLFELSLLGEFAMIPEVLIYLRETSISGCWDSYFSRCFNRRPAMLESKFLFWKFAFAHINAIDIHLNSFCKRIILKFLISFSILIKYRKMCGISI